MLQIPYIGGAETHNIVTFHVISCETPTHFESPAWYHCERLQVGASCALSWSAGVRARAAEQDRAEIPLCTVEDARREGGGEGLAVNS